MHLTLLPSDWMILALLLGAIIFIIQAKRQLHYRLPWRMVFQKKIGMIAAVILCFYATIGLLDSLHFTVLNQQMSALDLLISPLGKQDEKTYSKPFSIYLQQTSSPERLQFAGTHLKSVEHKNRDIAMRCAIGFAAGLLSFSVMAFIWIYYLSRRHHETMRHYFSLWWRGKTMIAWREAMLTFGFLWIVIWMLALLATHYHIFGTDKIGQDIFYETIKSIRTGLLVGTLTTIFMLPFALLCGMFAGYFGGLIDDVVQYSYITLSSIPGVLFISAMVLVMQFYIANHPHLFPTMADRADMRLLMLCFILGITSWANLCRLLRAETLKLREQEFVTAAIAVGVRRLSIIMRHILPNVMHIVFITIVLDFSGLVLAEAILSYVGVGVDPTTASWGNMINTSRLELAREPIVWWPLLAALVAMFFLVLAANLFSDAVRDAFDPRLKEV